MASLLLHRKSGKAPEVSSFAQTCNLLSLYLKERGSLGDIGVGMINGKFEGKGTETSTSPATTLNLLHNMEISDEASRQEAVESSDIKSMDLFPQTVGLGSSDPVGHSSSCADLLPRGRKSSAAEPATAPMTIFYGGRVMVFNDFPADTAKEIMALAGRSSSNSSIGSPFTSTTDTTNAAKLNDVQERLQVPLRIHGSDVPMARKASLHRFFAKRKERAAARAPYQISDSPSHLGLKL